MFPSYLLSGVSSDVRTVRECFSLSGLEFRAQRNLNLNYHHFTGHCSELCEVNVLSPAHKLAWLFRLFGCQIYFFLFFFFQLPLKG